MDIVSNKYHQHGQIKFTNHEQSKNTIIEQEKKIQVWLHRELTYHLKGIPYRYFLLKRN